MRILDLTRLLPGGFATQLLGDLGADVVKVEQPGVGDYMRWYEPLMHRESAYSWVVDRNKRSIALDLKDPAALEVLRRLVAAADVLVESFRPGVLDRLGAGYEELSAVNPALVYCSISGYGADGPLAQEAGHDINYIGRAGLLGVTGTDGRPVIPGVQIADVAGGGMMAVAGLLAALHRARATGRGDHVDVAMADGAFALLSVHWGAVFATGSAPGYEDAVLTGRYPCYNVYACADGRHLTVGALEPRFWTALCEGVGRPDLDGTREDSGALEEWRRVFASRSRDEWLSVLSAVDTCVGPVNDMVEALSDPQLSHRQMVVEQEHPALGPVPQVGVALKLRGGTGGIRSPAPGLGASAREVLADAGYEAAEIDALLADGVVGAPPEPEPAVG